MICNTEDLSPDEKAAVETLLGRRVQQGEAVSVRTFEPVRISRQRKLEISDELRKYLAEVDGQRYWRMSFQLVCGISATRYSRCATRRGLWDCRFCSYNASGSVQ
jgi:hypothetical protein